MGEGSSHGVLTYQLMVEEKLLHFMGTAEMNGRYFTACNYAKSYAEFVGVPVLPQKPMGISGGLQEQHAEWVDYYFELWDVISKKIRTNLIELRKKYRDLNDDVPEFKKSGKVALT